MNDVGDTMLGVCYRPPDQGEMRVSKNNEQEVAVCTSSSLCGILTIQTFSGRAAMCKQSKKLLRCMLATSQCKYWRGQTVLWCTWPSRSWMTAVRLWRIAGKICSRVRTLGFRKADLNLLRQFLCPNFNLLGRIPSGSYHEGKKCISKIVVL